MRAARRRRTLRWFVAAASLILSLVLAEAAGSAALSVRREASGDPPLPEELRAIVPLRPTPPMEYDAYLLSRLEQGVALDFATTNAQGLRNGPIELTPGADTYRVLLLGGSVAWGYHAPSDAESPAALLERYLNEHRERSPHLRGRRVEVLNAAVPGYVSWQSALAYSLDRRTLEPHAIVALEGINDWYSAILNGAVGVPIRSAMVGELLDSRKPTLAAWLNYRARRLSSIRFLRSLKPPAQSHAYPDPGEITRAYVRSIEHLAVFAAADDAVLFPVLQPTCLVEGAKPLTAYEAEVVRRQDLRFPGSAAHCDLTYAAFRRAFAELGRGRSHVRPIDASQVFADERALVFTDNCHLTPLGRELLVQMIGERILAALDG